MKEKVIEKFSDVYDFIEEISQNSSKLYFRGLENSTYEAMPSIFYANKEKKDKRLNEGISLVDLKKDTKETIKAYRELNSIEPHKTSNRNCKKLSDLDVLALYQHHRLSGRGDFKDKGTFLIDITTDVCTAIIFSTQPKQKISYIPFPFNNVGVDHIADISIEKNDSKVLIYDFNKDSQVQHVDSEYKFKDIDYFMKQKRLSNIYLYNQNLFIQPELISLNSVFQRSSFLFGSLCYENNNVKFDTNKINNYCVGSIIIPNHAKSSLYRMAVKSSGLNESNIYPDGNKML